jgi:hypothetical protein
MIIIAFDPGAWLGWCALAVDAMGPRYLAAGVISVEELGEARAREEALRHADQVRATVAAVERVERVLPTLAFQRGAAQQAGRLVAAAWLGGELAQGCRAAGRPVALVSAEQVRRHYVAPTGVAKRGERKPDMDAAVRAAVEHFVLWPGAIRGTGAAYRKDGSDLMSDRRAHAYDAALLALYAGTVLAPAPIAATPPPHAQLALRGGG